MHVVHNVLTNISRQNINEAIIQITQVFFYRFWSMIFLRWRQLACIGTVLSYQGSELLLNLNYGSIVLRCVLPFFSAESLWNIYNAVIIATWVPSLAEKMESPMTTQTKAIDPLLPKNVPVAVLCVFWFSLVIYTSLRSNVQQLICFSQEEEVSECTKLRCAIIHHEVNECLFKIYISLGCLWLWSTQRSCTTKSTN